MRILITKQQPLEAPGGETGHMFALANLFRARGVEVFLMPVTNHPTPKGLWSPDHTVEVRPFGLNHLLDSFAISRAADAFVRKIPVDAVLSWQYETAYLPHPAESRRFVHGVIAAAPFGTLKRMAASNPFRALAYHFFHFRLLRRADVIFCASQFSRSDLIETLGLPPEKIIVIPIGVDDIFQPLPQPPSGPLHTFIFSGYLDPIKGVFDALEALALLAARGHRDWVLKITGWGNVEAVRRFARQRGLESNVRFLGALDRPALAAEFAHADLAILPSHIETFGLSIAEAEASGIPVISYRVGAIPEILQDGRAGILVNPFDRAQLADAILRLVNDPAAARLMGRRGHEFIRRNFSWQKAAELMHQSIAELRR